MLAICLAASAIEPEKPAFTDWITDHQKKTENSNLTPRGLPSETPETGEALDWKIPVPEINPLGAQKLYNLGSGYKEAGDMKLVYLDNLTEVTKVLSGQAWSLSFKTQNGDVLPFLKEYARKIGGELFSASYDDSFVFRVTRQGSVWWCDVNARTRDRIDLRVLRQKILALNEELKITKNMFGRNGAFHFLADIPGRKFLLLQCRLANGGIRLRADNDSSTRDGMTLIRYMKYLNSAEYPEYTLYDFPQDPGLYEFSVDRQGASLPDEVTIRLTETSYDLPGYKSGGMGTLIVKNVPMGKVYATPQSFVDLRREGKSLGGGVSREYGAACGTDVTFLLPAGYYTVGSELKSEFREAKTQLVPVSAGEKTTVRLPEAWGAANRALMARGDDRELTGEILINGKKDLIQTAEIALSVSDPKERDVFPTRENTVITESGAPVEIKDIRREIAPCSIALAIDSSGSMIQDMKATLEAARTFLQSLPESSFVQVIDFDGAVRALKGSSVKDAVKNLPLIKAQGSTRLYDAAIKGVELVKDKPRPAVVVFTDGVDSREDKLGTGSTNTREQAVKKILEAGVPVYTIGFGKRLNADQTLENVDGSPDIGCLTEFAAVSNGQYYPAKDPEGLRAVFAAIGSRLGNNFVIIYRRPTENRTGNTPVVSLVIDNSGSMNMDPKKSNARDGNFRMEKTKRILCDFTSQLPEASVMQLTTFQGGGAMRVDVNRRQVSTTNKAYLLKAIGEMNPVDGTPVVAALTSAFENLASIPSQKKVIVFHTDSGLEVPREQVPEFQKILAKIRDKGMFVLWIGMGISSPSKEKVFAEAAKATDGEYVISESADEIARKLSSLLERLRKPETAKLVPLTITISYKTAQGETLTYKVQDQAEFSPPLKEGAPMEPDVVVVQAGEKAPLNEGAAVQKAAPGLAIEGVDQDVCARSEIGKSMQNKAMEITLRRAVYLDRMMGLEARRNNFQFIAIELELKNRTEKNIPYEIPSLFKHFYFGLDGKGLYPASRATWLLEKPITRHGNPSIRIPPSGVVAGTLVFLVPFRNDGFRQQSFHFFDTEYGHIQMPIAGEMSPHWLEVEKLPTHKPEAVSDAFTLNVTAAGLESKLDQYKAGDYGRFRVVEGEFCSKVQALLNLDPAKRIYLRYPTPAGDLMCRMSDVTAFTPLGFLDPVMLAPALTNVVRMVYDIPSALSSYESELYFDLADGRAVFPVSGGKKFPAAALSAEIDGDLVKVRINQLTQVPNGIKLTDENGQTRNLFKDSVLLDVTFVDKPGQEGTSIPPDFFVLVNKSFKPDSKAAAGRTGLGGSGVSRKDLLPPSNANQGLIFGLTGLFGVFEGQERRALVIFDPPGSDIANWSLQSSFNEKIQIPIAREEFRSPELIAYQARVLGHEPTFARLLDSAVNNAVKKYVALDHNLKYNPVIRLEKDDGYDDLVLPQINTLGIQTMSGITDENRFLDLMKSITCIPKNFQGGRVNTFNASPESVITQGFGDINSTANLAMEVLSRLGFSPRLGTLEFTDAGARLILEYYGIDVKREKSVPLAISYANSSKERKRFVIPFMKDLSELAGLVYQPRGFDNVPGTPDSPSALLSVYAVYEPASDDSLKAAAGDAGSALGGGSGKKTSELRMLQKNLRLDLLSRDAIDLAFAPVPVKGKISYGAFLMTPEGDVSGEKMLTDFRRITALRIEISGLDRNYIHAIDLAEGQKPENFLITLGINLPDLPKPAVEALDEAFRAVSAAKKPEPFTVARWHHRNVLYRLIAGQTTFDSKLVHADKLLMGRIQKPRCLVVDSELGGDGRLTTRIDLLQPFNEIHSGSEELKRAYFILNGFYQSSLESVVLGGDDRMGYLDLWRNAPKDAEILALAVSGNRDTFYRDLEKAGTYPPRLLRAVKENRKILFFQSKPTIVSGRERFAWLEMDPNTYGVLSVLDNGFHGAEYSMLTTSLGEDTREFVKGTWLGVNMSVWSVGSIALKTQNKAQIFTEGKALALKIGAILAEFQDNVGKAKEYYDKINELKEQTADMMEQMGEGGEGGEGEGDQDDTDYGAKMKETLTQVFDQMPPVKILGVDVNAKLKEGFRGFSNGYNTSVDVYFHFFGGNKPHIEVGKGGDDNKGDDK